MSNLQNPAVQYDLAGQLIYHLGTPMAFLTPNLEYVVWTKEWEDSFNVSGEIEVGKHHYDVFPAIPKSRPEWLAHHLKCSRGEHLSGYESNFAGRKFNWSLTPVPTQYGPNFYVKMRVEFID